jgi:hypothetical protein
MDVGELKERLKQDRRVVLMFKSPGEDGLKVLFRLKERCYDEGVYSLFYKSFIKFFGMQHHLTDVLDTVTSDVTRACFVSMDTDAYYNDGAEAVVLEEYVDLNSAAGLFDMKHDYDKEEKSSRKAVKDDGLIEPESKDPDKDTLQHIKEVLQQRKAALVEEKYVYVPEQLEQIMNGLISFIEDQGISVYEVQNIQYAKKIRCKLGVRLAEINLFYGKRGFRPVQSPRTGTSQELNEIVEEIIKVYLHDNI